jgi:hypothetical protein
MCGVANPLPGEKRACGLRRKSQKKKYNLKDFYQ